MNPLSRNLQLIDYTLFVQNAGIRQQDFSNPCGANLPHPGGAASARPVWNGRATAACPASRAISGAKWNGPRFFGIRAVSPQDPGGPPWSHERKMSRCAIYTRQSFEHGLEWLEVSLLVGAVLTEHRAWLRILEEPLQAVRTDDGRSLRYKGTAPFQYNDVDRKTFFGRDREVRSLLSLVLAVWISRSITRSLGQCAALFDVVAKGDLTGRMNLDQKDEIGQLAAINAHSASPALDDGEAKRDRGASADKVVAQFGESAN
jgi:hypothetical protein